MSYLNETFRISDGVFAIEEVKNIWKYVIVGENAALLIDTGFGFADFKDKIREITDLPLIVVNTHGDIDHVSGNYLFDEVYISVQDFRLLPGNDNIDFKRSQLLARITWDNSKLLEEVDTAAMRAWLEHSVWETTYHFVEHGHVFNLGNRMVEVIAIPGHTPGSIALLDSKTGFLFSGDNLVWGFSHFLCPVPLVNRPCEPLPVFYNSLKKLKRRQPDISSVYPSHGKIGLSPMIIDDVMAAVRELYEDNSKDRSFLNWIGVQALEHKKSGNDNVGLEYARDEFEIFSSCPLEVD